jgi:hypothetical protein
MSTHHYWKSYLYFEEGMELQRFSLSGSRKEQGSHSLNQRRACQQLEQLTPADLSFKRPIIGLYNFEASNYSILHWVSSLNL